MKAYKQFWSLNALYAFVFIIFVIDINCASFVKSLQTFLLVLSITKAIDLSQVKIGATTFPTIAAALAHKSGMATFRRR